MTADNLPALALSEQDKDLVITKLERKSPDKLAQARAMADELEFSNTRAILGFGVSNQKGLIEFTDTVLSNVRAGDAGPAGQLMSELKGKIMELDVGALGKSSTGGALSNVTSHIPLIGGWLSARIDAARAFMRRYETLKVQIDDVIKRLDEEKVNQIEHLSRLDTLYERNVDYFDALEILIAAGELKFKQMQAEFERRKAELAGRGGDVESTELQEIKDFADLIQSLDRRLYNLKLGRISAVTSGPTIRVAQEGSKSIVEMIQESILMMVPEWKKQVVIAISLFDQKRAMAMIRETRDVTNNLMLSTSQMLGESQAEVKQAQGEGFVKVETLQKITENLIATIDQGIKMDLENKKKRAEGIRKLGEAEEKLKQAMKSAQESVLV